MNTDGPADWPPLPFGWWKDTYNDFLLPYEAVRTAPSPEAAIAAFVDSTYDPAATLGRWDRAALERPMLRGSR